MPPIVCRLPVEAVECSNQWRERMSSFPSAAGQPSYYSQQQCRQQQQHHQQQQPTWSLNDLSTELLTLIFQQVRFSVMILPAEPGPILLESSQPINLLNRFAH